MIIPTEFFIWVPKSKNYHCKIYINDVDETSNVVESSFTKVATIGIGDLKIKLLNPRGIKSNVYSAGQTAKFYGDLTNGTTLQFWGRIDYTKDSLSQDGQFLEIEGRHRSYIASETLVCMTKTNTEVSQVLKDMITAFLPSFPQTWTYINSTGINITVNWNYKPFWECIKILCAYTGFDCYIDDNLLFHFFAENSVMNSDEAIVEGDNFIKISDWGTDDYYTKTQVTAMGQDDQGIPILYTATSGASGDTREIFIKDTSANTMAQVQALAEAKLSDVINVPPQAKTTSFGLNPVNQGDNIWISVPRQKIHGIYKLLQITHKFGQKTSWQTECIIEREIKGTEQVLAERSRKEIEIQEAPNPNKLNYSHNFTFDDSTNIETNVDCSITGGRLQLATGQTTGYVISVNKDTTNNITKIELRYSGWNLGDSTFEVSVNGGLNYQTVTANTLFTPSYSGHYLKIKVTLNSTASNSSPNIDSMAILYS